VLLLASLHNLQHAQHIFIVCLEQIDDEITVCLAHNLLLRHDVLLLASLHNLQHAQHIFIECLEQLDDEISLPRP
jgi:hypothetical protein